MAQIDFDKIQLGNTVYHGTSGLDYKVISKNEKKRELTCSRKPLKGKKDKQVFSEHELVDENDDVLLPPPFGVYNGRGEEIL